VLGWRQTHVESFHSHKENLSQIHMVRKNFMKEYTFKLRPEKGYVNISIAVTKFLRKHLKG
jgi:hypothetical protein